jgi:septal ring factor EnvC (AmiA/AmiB activator)
MKTIISTNGHKNTIRDYVFLFLIFSLLASSCVSGKKFAASEAKADKLQKDNVKTQNQLTACNAQLQSLNDQKASLQNEYSSIPKGCNVEAQKFNCRCADKI